MLAVTFPLDGAFVYVKGAEGWDKRPVQTGLSDGVNIEVRSGLSEGETVRGTEIIKNTRK